MNNQERTVQEIAALTDKFPGIVIIQKLPDLSLEYVSPRGIELFGESWNVLKHMSVEQYQDRFFSQENRVDFFAQLSKLVETNSEATVSHFQQIRCANGSDWQWCMSTSKILLRDENNNPSLLLTNTILIDQSDGFAARASKLLDEDAFSKRNYEKYESLGRREKEILKHLALGKSAPEIAKEIFVAQTTVDTHRKNIKRKLNTGNRFELSLYARAFNLI